MAFNRSGWKEKKPLSNENQSAEAPTSKLGFITDEQAVVVSSPLVVSRSSELRDGCQDFGKSSRILQNIYTAVTHLAWLLLQRGNRYTVLKTTLCLQPVNHLVKSENSKVSARLEFPKTYTVRHQ